MKQKTSNIFLVKKYWANTRSVVNCELAKIQLKIWTQKILSGNVCAQNIQVYIHSIKLKNENLLSSYTGRTFYFKYTSAQPWLEFDTNYKTVQLI